MSIVLNANLLATLSPHNMSGASDSLRKSLGRLSLEKRINSSSDDSEGLSITAKITFRISRTNSNIRNYKNALSYLRAVDANLSATGKIFGRMTELRVMAQDVTKKSADIENYCKEFVELQSQLSQISSESFFGKRLFDSNSADHFNSELKLGTTSLGPAECNTFSVAITTDDPGNFDSESVSINVENFQFMLSLGSLAMNGIGHFYNIANIERENGTIGVNADGYIDDIKNVSVGQFIDIMERITVVRAENGAEQKRLMHTFNLLQSTLTNFEAVHARIIHKDTALKTSRLARQGILAQECVSRSTKANQFTKAVFSLTA